MVGQASYQVAISPALYFVVSFYMKRAGLKLVEFRLSLHHRAQQDNILKS